MPRELEVQRYLRGGKTLSDLRQRYDIQSAASDELGAVAFNYRYLAPLETPLVRECRGLVLQTGTWDVLSKSIDAFFEPEDKRGADIASAFDWSSAYAVEKFDGALVCLYFHLGEWRVATRFSADGHIPVYSLNGAPSSLDWRELTQLAAEDMGHAWEGFTARLDPRVYYAFELCAPENRVVVVHPDRRLHLVAAVSAETLDEIDPLSLPLNDLVPPRVPVRSMEEVRALVEAHSEPYRHEGWVLVDGAFRRLKIRNPRFVSVMRTFSARDEAAVLREIVMVDAMGSSPSTTPTTASSGSGCPQVDERVLVADGGTQAAGRLAVGDRIVGRFGRGQTVVRADLLDAEIVVVRTERGESATSPSHGYFHANGTLVAAGAVDVGDLLVGPDLIPVPVLSVAAAPAGRVVRIECVPDHEYVSGGLLAHNEFKTVETVDDFRAFGAPSADGAYVRRVNANDVVARVLLLVRWAADAWDAIKSLPEEQRAGHPLYDVWPSAVRMLEEGESMSDVLGRHSEEDQIAALRRFEQTMGGR